MLTRPEGWTPRPAFEDESISTGEWGLQEAVPIEGPSTAQDKAKARHRRKLEWRERMSERRRERKQNRRIQDRCIDNTIYGFSAQEHALPRCEKPALREQCHQKRFGYTGEQARRYLQGDERKREKPTSTVNLLYATTSCERRPRERRDKSTRRTRAPGGDSEGPAPDDLEASAAGLDPEHVERVIDAIRVASEVEFFDFNVLARHLDVLAPRWNASERAAFSSLLLPESFRDEAWTALKVAGREAQS